MKQNILITGYDYTLSKRISKKVAEVFSLRTLDQLEMFNFDHSPRKFDEVLSTCGDDYVKNELRCVIKMELDFDEVAFSANICFAENCKDLYFRIKLSNFVILLKKNTQEEVDELSKADYSSKQEKKFYCVSAKTLKDWEQSIENDCADIVVDVTNLTDEQIVKKIEEGVENYYHLS